MLSQLRKRISAPIQTEHSRPTLLAKAQTLLTYIQDYHSGTCQLSKLRHSQTDWPDSNDQNPLSDL
jgi:hypothetical protein